MPSPKAPAAALDCGPPAPKLAASMEAIIAQAVTNQLAKAGVLSGQPAQAKAKAATPSFDGANSLSHPGEWKKFKRAAGDACRQGEFKNIQDGHLSANFLLTLS